jgi:hypothetical protein
MINEGMRKGHERDKRKGRRKGVWNEDRPTK